MSIAQRLASNTPNSDLEEAFFEYHRANPDVYDLFKKFSLEMKRTGRKNYGCLAIMNRVRWETDIQTSSTDGFKINNNFYPYYSRLLMENEAELAGFFRTRRVVGEKAA